MKQAVKSRSKNRTRSFRPSPEVERLLQLAIRRTGLRQTRIIEDCILAKLKPEVVP